MCWSLCCRFTVTPSRIACFRPAVSVKPPLLLLDFAVLVLSFVLSLKLLNCGLDFRWLLADACVGARIVPASNNDAIAAAAITIPIDCFLSFILFFSTRNYFLMSICEVCRLLLYLNFDLSNS